MSLGSPNVLIAATPVDIGKADTPTLPGCQASRCYVLRQITNTGVLTLLLIEGWLHSESEHRTGSELWRSVEMLA